MATQPSPSEPGPQPIRKLEQSVINRIAAGEIIHRPASALKELIENSLDAGSTSIRVTIKDGGMKLLQIQDNGSGIRHDDLPILAQRFTTSKLATFSDLSRLTTYGFRGEALASVSYVAHMTVVTKTRADSCAWKACYADGALTLAKAGTSADPKPCAGNDGTTITVENLFYNTPTRLSALRSSSEEYARILDVVTKYAIHNPHVSFTCRKAGSPTPDVSTPSSSTTTQAIRLLYGQSIAKELLHTTVSSKTPSEEDADEEVPEESSWDAEAYFTSANYQAKKLVFLLFINHRLVESAKIRKAVEAVYTGVLPKGASPYVYFSLNIDPRSVDVNVHPTKREVHFLNDDEIVERICDALQEKLVGQSQSRVFEYQTLLTGGIAETPTQDNGKGKKRARDEDEMDVDEAEPPPTSQAARPKKMLSQHKVRTSLQDRTLDSMFPVFSPSQQRSGNGSGGGSPNTGTGTGTPPQNAPRVREIKESQCYLSSVKQLRAAVVKGKHNNLTEILQKHTFVCIVDVNKCLSLVQHSTKLYLINHGALAEELFYQLGLRQFGDMSRLRLDPAPPLRTLVTLAVDVEEGVERSKMTRPQIVDCIVDTLISRREMLEEYFSLGISADGKVETLPMLLRDCTPNLDKLPLFLMRLGPQVDWTAEKECFECFLRELAFFYVPEPVIQISLEDMSEQEKAEDKAVQWQIQHVLFPAAARYLAAPKSLLDRDVVQVANLPDLYRVFERC
ncbi:DNA mismatch repair protein MutL [Fomitopsis serialis]|uniref:DNA mismatch repair protein MutL n=1 Tax=Fomitopsis serialis TaxID=139415 RepID=UPI002007493C|nr:DNA mismatch repair protein MutL [Neoantrodia serialis]KAH9926723.1 DNA mismatch repair protein MutL [Neoantrodia serialis]